MGVNNLLGENQMSTRACYTFTDRQGEFHVYKHHDGYPYAHEIRVLKTYKLAKNETGDQHARWYTVAKSPMTYGSWEYGDTYRKDVTDNFRLTYASPEFIEAYRDDPAILITA